MLTHSRAVYVEECISIRKPKTRGGSRGCQISRATNVKIGEIITDS
jgi:hypothetical protein